MRGYTLKVPDIEFNIGIGFITLSHGIYIYSYYAILSFYDPRYFIATL